MLSRMLLALLALPLLAAAPISSLSSDQLDQQLASIQHVPNIGDRVDAVSKLFLGAPYVDFPLGEGGSGPEPQDRFRLDGVDCQTYVETVLALINARNTGHAKAILDDIRYAKEPYSFATRNHFTEAQWLPSLTDKGYLRDEVPAIDGRAPSTALILVRDRWSQVSFLKRLEPAEIPEGRFPIKYLTSAELRKHAGSIEPGSVILVVREADPKRIVRVSHMGFVVRGAQGISVRHASSVERKVVEEPLGSYLTRMGEMKKWKVEGYGLYMPLDAKVRATQVLPK
jgi:Protein of unknown function (DUF1460)